MITQKYLNDLTYNIIGAAIEVHRILGPGLLESVYHKCFKSELFERNLNYKSEMYVPLAYKKLNLETELRLDLLVEDQIAVELKAIEAIHPLHEAQLMTYMRILDIPKGILINFNCTNIFKEGQRTRVNEIFTTLPKL